MKWIPITEPPELSTPAIVFDPTAVIKIFTAFYLPLNTTEFAAVFHQGTQPLFNVTHWMPLPTNPNESNEGEERKFSLKEALEIIASTMAEDKSEGSYYYSWQANIAMAFKDEFDRQHAARKDFTRWLFIENGLHEIANNAAKNFLNILIQRIP